MINNNIEDCSDDPRNTKSGIGNSRFILQKGQNVYTFYTVISNKQTKVYQLYK